jgi:hypothetical protein
MLDTILDCKIYLNTETLHDEIESVAQLLSGTVNLSTIHFQNGEIDVVKNEDFNEVSCKQFPDGFLYFRYYLEFYAFPEQQMQCKIEVISNILEYFWGKNIPAVAASDYENELPNNGGYNSSFIPWIN